LVENFRVVASTSHRPVQVSNQAVRSNNCLIFETVATVMADKTVGSRIRDVVGAATSREVMLCSPIIKRLLVLNGPAAVPKHSINERPAATVLRSLHA